MFSSMFLKLVLGNYKETVYHHQSPERSNMIKSLSTKNNRIPEPVTLDEIDFPSPFYEGLQYNAPARGVWNIVHTGMLIPESHQVYVCAQGCLRGVILTAAEMNDMERMSWVALRESDMWNGEMEKRVIEGTQHIIEKIKENPKQQNLENQNLENQNPENHNLKNQNQAKQNLENQNLEEQNAGESQNNSENKSEAISRLPRCVLIYLSCMHMFEGCDFQMITDELSELYPDIDFVECYMIPTMRKTMSPDAMMKISLYEAVKKQDKDENLVALVGSNLPFDKESDVCSLINMSGRNIWDIAECKTYDEYLKLGAAPLTISYLAVADASCRQMSQRLDQKWLRLLINFDEKKLDDNLRALGEELGLGDDDVTGFIEERREQAYKALDDAHEIIGNTPIAIDYTAFPYIIELAELLTKHGFNVTRLYSDGFPGDEKNAFERLKEIKPEIKVYPTNDPAMRFATEENNIASVDNICNNSTANEPNASTDSDSVVSTLAIGQKAAYFTGTDHFVDIVEGGGMYGYTAIRKLAGLMTEAYLTAKDTKKVISHKGWGCESCL